MAEALSSHKAVILSSDTFLIALNCAGLNKSNLSILFHTVFEFSSEEHALTHLFACLYFLWQARIKEKGKVRVVSKGEMQEWTDLKGAITYSRGDRSMLCGKGMHHAEAALPRWSLKSAPCRDWTLKLTANVLFGFFF